MNEILEKQFFFVLKSQTITKFLRAFTVHKIQIKVCLLLTTWWILSTYIKEIQHSEIILSFFFFFEFFFVVHLVLVLLFILILISSFYFHFTITTCNFNVNFNWKNAGHNSHLGMIWPEKIIVSSKIAKKSWSRNWKTMKLLDFEKKKFLSFF